jgi:DNA-directed RNA polymerase specialized sigma24 family protein
MDTAVPARILIRAHAAFGSLLRSLRRFHDLAAAEATVRELLRRYAGGHEEAFTLLVHRHAPMVWGVCRRMLDNEQDAEDAFQAVFLVLLRKGALLPVPQSLAAFLQGVAYRISQKAKMTSEHRRRHEARSGTRTANNPLAAVELRELRALLDEALARLPEKYRAPPGSVLS